MNELAPPLDRATAAEYATCPAESGPRQDVAANRELWGRVNAEHTGEHAFRARAAEDITWGVFNGFRRRLRGGSG